MLQPGSKIKVLNASYGWGNVIKNDVGVIRHVDKVNETYCVNVIGKSFSWSCKDGDLGYLRPKVNKTHPATQFVESYMAYLEGHIKNGDIGASTKARLKKTLKNIALPDTDIIDGLSSMVKDLRYISEEHAINFITKPCVINYRLRNGKIVDVPVGHFDCYLSLCRQGTYFKQLESKHYLDNEYDHPHVSGSSPCWGNYVNVITPAFETSDITTLISTSLDFLNSCDRSGWYRSVLQWLTRTQMAKYEIMDICQRCEEVECECNYCERCNSEGDRCSCRYCEDCDAYEEDCECLRCPNSWDQLDDESFPDNQCEQCTNLFRNIDSGFWECHYDGPGYPHFSTELEYFTPNEANARYNTLSNNRIQHHPNELKRMEEMSVQLERLHTTDAPEPVDDDSPMTGRVFATTPPTEWRRLYGSTVSNDDSGPGGAAGSSGS